MSENHALENGHCYAGDSCWQHTCRRQRYNMEGMIAVASLKSPSAITDHAPDLTINGNANAAHREAELIFETAGHKWFMLEKQVDELYDFLAEIQSLRVAKLSKLRSR